MRNKLRYITLIILIAVAFQAAGQSYEIDRVCVGAERHYRLDGEAGSVYTWQLTDVGGIVTILPETADSVTIIWNMVPGSYYLSALQYGVNGCDSLQLGSIQVFDLPDAFAGNNITLCAPEPVILNIAGANNYSSLRWTTSGDGNFDDEFALNPTYTLGPNDIALGGVTLTLTANGLANVESCPPAESSITVTINNLIAGIDITPVTCFGLPDGTVIFTASGGTEPYTYSLDGNTNATGVFTGLVADTYNYIIIDAAGCEITGEVIITQPEELFAQITPLSAALCFNESLPLTGTFSGGTGVIISHSWTGSGAVYLNATNVANPVFTAGVAGIYTLLYNVTDENGCEAVSAETTLTVNDETIPIFAQIGPLCQNSIAPDLPLTSTNNINGSWSPAVINTTIMGTTTYTFTPDLGQCAVVVIMEIEVTDEISPIFAQIGPLCQNSIAPDLPLTSTNNITGTWNPAVISTTVIGTTTYTFTPDAGQCSVVASMEIEISEGLTPIFAQIGPLCQNIIAPDLPLTSANNITGVWNPAVINTTAIGTTTYTFTPDAGQCAEVVTMAIEVSDEITPIFAQIGPLCQNSIAPDLPLTSTNNITGAWNPAVINTTAIGTTSYTFIPDAGQCSVVLTMEIEVSEGLTPIFAQIGPLCQNSLAPDLPLTSINNITGTWSPSVINTTITGATTYTFTPDNGQCNIIVSMDITINNLIADIAITPISCFGLADGTVTFIASGGTEPYTYELDGIINNTGYFPGLTSDTYTYVITYNGGCAITGEVAVTEPPAIVATAEPTGTSCNQENGIINVIASGGTGGLEFMIEGITGWQTENLFTGLIAGTYAVMVRDAGGCETTLTGITVENISGPSITNIEVNNAMNSLPNGSANIVADSPAQPLQYSLTNNGTDWQLTPFFGNMAVGPYIAYVMDANGCSISQEFDVLNIVVGEVEISADTVTYCLNLPVVIPVEARDFTGISSFVIELEFDPSVLSFNGLTNVNGSLENGTFSTSIVGDVLQIRYSIFDSSATVVGGQELFSLVFNSLVSGNSNLTWNWLQCAIYSSGNDSLPAIYVDGMAEILPAPAIYADGAGVYCEGDLLSLHSGSFDDQLLSYEWTGPTGFKHNRQDWQLGQLGMNDNGNFQVIATNPEFCSMSQTVAVKVNPKPILHIGYADTICLGQQVLLDAGIGFVSYLWHDGSTEQSQYTLEEGTYWVQVVDTNDCIAVDTVRLMPCNIELLIPNAFSPNGDGLNDTFKPLISGWEPSNYLMQIYTKWGQLIFETNNYTEGWDGTANGALVMPNTFVYVISYEAPSYVTRTALKSPVIGDVTVIK